MKKERKRERKKERGKKREGKREKREREKREWGTWPLLGVAASPLPRQRLPAALVRISRSWVKTPSVSDVRRRPQNPVGGLGCPWGLPGPQPATNLAQKRLREVNNNISLRWERRWGGWRRPASTWLRCHTVQYACDGRCLCSR